MRPLSAIDAIAPAFTRTHELLFQPFRWGGSWKLSASSYLGFCGSIFIPLPLIFFFLPRHSFNADNPHPTLVAAFAAVVSVVFLALFYFGARMELVNFEMVVMREKIIAPMWRRAGERMWPMIWTKVILGTVLCLILMPALIHAGVAWFHMMQQMPRPVPGQVQSPAEIRAQMSSMMQGMLGFYGVVYGSFFLLKIFSTILNDFVVPFYLIEGVSLFVAARMAAQVIAADPVQVILYLFMKLVLSVLGLIAYFVAFIISEIALAIPLVILVVVGVFIGMALTKLMGASATILMIVAAVIVYAAFFVALMYISLGLFGYLITLLEAYGIYFLGGRYPRLGELLEPSAPPPFRYTPPPSFSSPEEEDDDTNDPPLPMDPALA